MNITASLWPDRDPEFSLILNISGLDIIIKNPYIYNNDQWILNYDLVNDNKNCTMTFNDIILYIKNDTFLLIDKDIIYDLKLDKYMILDMFSVIINSKEILRYEYWTRSKSIIK